MHTHFQECLDNQSVLIHTCMMSMMTVRVLSWVGPRNFRTRFIRVMLLHSMKSSSPSWLLRTSSSFNNSATCGEFNVLLRNLELKKQNWVNYKQQLDPHFFLLQKFQGIKLWTVLSVKGKTRFSKKKVLIYYQLFCTIPWMYAPSFIAIPSWWVLLIWRGLFF